MSARMFEINEARRAQVPLLIGISGASFCGKTFSALRLATGIAKINKGPIVYIDTEGRRALHYADDFRFKHIEFTAPYGSLDYVAAIDAALRSNPSVIVVDSVTHEHEGTGGYLDLANQEHEAGKRDGQMYAKPSVARRRLLSRIQTLPCSGIFCFRGDEKLDWKSVFEKKTKQPQSMGQTIIGTAAFAYEMTIRFLLKPGNNGTPTWRSDLKGEQSAIKLPKPFLGLFGGEPRQISESDGEAMARWALGEQLPQPGAKQERTITDEELEQLGGAMLEAADLKALASLRACLKGVTLTDDQTDYISARYQQRKRELEAAA